MRCYSVGIFTSYGSANAVLDFFRNQAEIVGFEARPKGETHQEIESKWSGMGAKSIIVPSCVSGTSGTERFRVNKHQSSSSLLPPAEGRRSWHVPYGHARTWGENTELDKIIEVECLNLQDIVEGELALPPDFISLDAQGVEGNILEGGRKVLDEEVVGIISEINFLEIYEGQSLFHDQAKLLHEERFLFTDMHFAEFWHPGPMAGRGFLTVSIALFLRDMEVFVERARKGSETAIYKLAKLGMISMLFEQFSYAYTIAKYLATNHPEEAKHIFQTTHYRDLEKLYTYMDSNMDKYEQDRRFFKDRIELRDRYSLPPIFTQHVR